MIMAFGVGMLSTIALQPLFLEHMLGYPAATAGLLMAPRGIAVAVGMSLVATLITRVEPRWLVLIGLITRRRRQLRDDLVQSRCRHSLDYRSRHRPRRRHGHDLRAAVDARLSDSAEGGVRPGRQHLQPCTTVGGSVGVAIAATVLTRDRPIELAVTRLQPQPLQSRAWHLARHNRI